MVSTTIKPNSYFDSVTLMRITAEIVQIPGVKEASVCMGTPLNKELLIDSGLDSPNSQQATANDLIIAFAAEDQSVEGAVLSRVEAMLNQKTEGRDSEDAPPKTVRTAVNSTTDANLAVISVPGKYAYLEAKEALLAGLNVMMFSDNLTISEEKALKDFAHEQGLLMMGPDCGSVIINGIGIGFANEVTRGPISVVAASGTGLQEITVLVDRYGGGIQHAIGVGGRDLSKDIGGMMMLDALSVVAEDDETKVIVLLSKKPDDEVAKQIIQAAKTSAKPTVVCFLGETPAENISDNLHFVSTLEQAALKALELSGIVPEVPAMDLSLVETHVERFTEEQQFVRGLYSGGTLCSEAFLTFKRELPSVTVQSNTSKVASEKLSDPLQSEGHSFVDLGDDNFTAGKAHPMIDPSIRNARIIQEAKDKEVAVILLDFVIGYGASQNPVGAALGSIKQAQAISPHLAFIGYVCGTDKDLQGLDNQRQLLRDQGVILANSNVEAAQLAVEFVRRMQA